VTAAAADLQVRAISADEVTSTVTMRAATHVLESALRDGLDPDSGARRMSVRTSRGAFLLMPWEYEKYCGVKIVTVAPGNPERGLPRINGSYLLFDAASLRPLALIDGVALTLLRTPALSALAIDGLAAPDARRLMIFGAGPQAWHHIQAVRSVRPIDDVVITSRSPSSAEAFVKRYRAADQSITVRAGQPSDVQEADIVACCTSSAEPVYDGRLLKDSAVIVAVGSHEPGRREVDDATMARSTVVVESISAALEEAGDVVIARDRGTLSVSSVLTLSQVVTGRALVPLDRPRVFKSVGMPWEDLVIAGAVYDRLRRRYS
jgi:ornithine cyclodeaminase/alanine dehydrogenase-like protein (mu-crystallin family)